MGPIAAIGRAELMQALSYDIETGVFRWRVPSRRVSVGDVAGCVDNGYVRIKVKQRAYRAHRIAWLFVHGEWPSDDIDHINGDRSDNRIANLRDVPRAINCQNLRRARRDNKSSGLLGVTRDRGMWLAQISVGGRNRLVGRFSDANQAHAAYVAAKRQQHPGCTL